MEKIILYFKGGKQANTLQAMGGSKSNKEHVNTNILSNIKVYRIRIAKDWNMKCVIHKKKKTTQTYLTCYFELLAVL